MIYFLFIFFEMNAKDSSAKTVIKYAAVFDGDVYGPFLHNVIVPKIINRNHVANFDNINIWLPDNKIPSYIQGLQGRLNINQKSPYMYDVRDNTNNFLFILILLFLQIDQSQ